jgi:predicted phage gp36 major capsid-like protein
MKQLIKWIVDFVISFLKDFLSKTKIKKLEEEVKDASQKADEEVKHANKGYDDFMSKYNAYKSDLKRRGLSTVRRDAGKLRGSSEGSEKGDRKPESSDKETKELDK